MSLIGKMFALSAALAFAATVPNQAFSSSAHAAKPDPGDKRICKRFPTTGSLVASYRTCKTKSEWDREREAIRTSNTNSACGAGAECEPRPNIITPGG